MLEELVPKNFHYPVIKETDFHFGSLSGLVSPLLRPDGDWRDYTPPPETQEVNGVESAACFIEAQQHTIATIMEEQFGIKDQNFAARFNIQFTNATPTGGDPLQAAQSFRDDGLIPDAMLPFTEDIRSWEEFNSFKGADSAACIAYGKGWRQAWEPTYEIVIRKEDSIGAKYQKLSQALKHSPVDVSVYAWVRDGSNQYIKPVGVEDNHLVELVYVDNNNCPYIFDTYAPFIKKLAPMYDFDFGIKHSLKKLDVRQTEISIIQKLIVLLKQLLNA